MIQTFTTQKKIANLSLRIGFFIALIWCSIANVSAQCNLDPQWSHYSLGGDTMRFYAYDTNTAAHHIWSWGDGTSTSGVIVTNHIYAAPGTYHVCFYVYIPGTTCSDSSCESVTVSAPPCSLDAQWSYTDLGGDSVRFTTPTDSNTTHHHGWNFGDGSSSSSGITGTTHVYALPGTYHVCQYVYVSGGCIDSFCQNVVVAGSGTCNLTADWLSYSLGGDTVRFYGADTNSVAHHIWSWGDGSSYGTADGDTAINHVYVATGTYHVCLYVYIPGVTNCTDSLCKNVTVAPPPCQLNAAWSFTVHGDSVYFVGEDTISSNHHGWNFGDGTYATSNTSDPTHIYAHSGTYHVCLYVYISGCTDSFCQNVTIQPTCNANFSYYAFGTSDSASFYSTSTSSDSIVAYDWSFGDGSNGQGRYIHHTYSQPGTYIVCLAIGTAGGCQSTHCDTIYIAGNTGCGTASFRDSIVGTTVYVFSTSTGVTSHTNYSWHLDGGTSVAANPNTAYTFNQLTNGYHKICLYIYNSTAFCDSICQYVYIGTPCNIRYGWTYTTRGDSVFFNAEDTVSAAHHFWNFGDGTTTTTSTTDPIHVYAQPGAYHVCFYVYLPGVASCSDSFCQTVAVTALPHCTVSAHWNSYQLGGDSVRFYGPDTNSTAHHIWVWGDGTYTSGVTVTNHTFPLPGTYHVCYYVYIPGTTCTDSLCDNVTVGGNGGTPATCNITANWTYYSIGGDSLKFHTSDTNTAAHHIWTFGDGTYAAATIDPTHIYTHPGTYHVCLYVYIPGTNCSDSSCSTVTIAAPATPPCTINANWGSYPGNGDTVRFYAQDTTSAAHHIWVWGDGTYTSGISAIHAFTGAGTYHVCLYVYVPGTTCSDSLCKDITVGGNPCNTTAQWSAYSLGGDTVRFYSADTNTAAHHIWVWGDGSYTSGTTETTHIYGDTGTYHVCYYVYIPGTNCIDSLCQDVEISADGHFRLTAHWVSSSLGGDTVGFLASDTSTTAYEIWSFGDGSFAFNTTNPTHTYAQSGTYNVCFYIFIPGTDFSDTVCNTIVVTVLGLENVTGENIRIITQPNPFSQSTVIRTEGLNGTFDFKLYDVVGKLLHYEKGVTGSYTLQREGLSSGMYVFEILQGGKVIGTGKLVAE